jgi:WD40 repeat protein
MFYRRRKAKEGEEITVVVLDEDGKPRRESASVDMSVYPSMTDDMERMTENPLHNPMLAGAATAAAAGGTPFLLAAAAGCTDAITACTGFRRQRLPFATGGKDGGVSVWDTVEHTVIWYTKPAKDDGRRSSKNRRVSQQQEEDSQAYGHSKAVLSLTQHPEGTSFFSCGADNLIKEWPVYAEEGHEDGAKLRTPPLRVWRAPSKLNSISHAVQGPTMVTGGEALLTWDTNSRQETPVAEFYPHNDLDENVRILRVAFSPFRKDLVCFTTTDGRISLFDVTRQAVVSQYDPFPQSPPFTSVAWNPVTNNMLVAGSEDGRVYYFDCSSSMMAVLPQGEFEGNEGAVVDVAFSPTGTLIASADSAQTVRLFNLRQPKKSVAVFKTKTQRAVYCVGWSGMEKGDRLEDLQVMSGSSDRNLRFWDPTANKQ